MRLYCSYRLTCWGFLSVSEAGGRGEREEREREGGEEEERGGEGGEEGREGGEGRGRGSHRFVGLVSSLRLQTQEFHF